ncbi:MAG TPA: hypothetical protein VFP60_04525 [Pseudolabrys sp.]|nr:hypothetical protein [Pseudolabrys sp.]
MRGFAALFVYLITVATISGILLKAGAAFIASPSEVVRSSAARPVSTAKQASHGFASGKAAKRTQKNHVRLSAASSRKSTHKSRLTGQRPVARSHMTKHSSLTPKGS